MNDLQSLQDSSGMHNNRQTANYVSLQINHFVLSQLIENNYQQLFVHQTWSMECFNTTLIILKVKNSNKKKQGNIKRPAHMAINSAGLSCSSVQSAEREAPPEPNKMTSNRLQVRIRDVANTAWGWHVGLMAFSWTMVLNHHPYSPHRKTVLTACKLCADSTKPF